MTFAELPTNKKAFIFELDNVLFPVKDYDLQVYYLFANFLEFQETFPPANDLLQFMKKVYENHGPDRIFEKAKEVYAFDEKYRENFLRLNKEAKLPLKLLLYQNVLSLLQDMVVDRKQLFIITAGNPLTQLNKIKHLEWHGLEKFLKVYFSDENVTDTYSSYINKILSENSLSANDVLMFGSKPEGKDFVSPVDIDYLTISNFI